MATAAAPRQKATQCKQHKYKKSPLRAFPEVDSFLVLQDITPVCIKNMDTTKDQDYC